MTLEAPSDSPRGLTPTQWLICVIAAIGFAFDIYELLMALFIVRPALMELGGLTPGTDAFANWAGAMLYVVVEELIPESQRSGNTDLATLGTIGGFAVMMVLDVALG